LESSVQVYDLLGMRDEAFRALEELVRAKGSLQMIVLSPDLEEFRRIPRYAAIMKGIKGIPSVK
jgi:hypothetical protein